MCGCNKNKGVCSKRKTNLNTAKSNLSNIAKTTTDAEAIAKYKQVIDEIESLMNTCPSQAEVDAIQLFTKNELLQRN